MLNKFFYPLLLFTIGVLVFHSVLFKGFILDDKTQVINNSTIHTLNNIPKLFVSSLHYTENPSFITGFTYRPITYTSYAILYALGSGTSFVFHLFLLLLYITNAILVYYFFTRFLTYHYAFFLALLFLVHPINQEIATYIADIQDALYFFFGLCSLLIASKFAWNFKHLLFIGACLFASMLSKETGLLFLLYILIYGSMFRKVKMQTLVGFTTCLLLCYVLLRIQAGQTPFLTITVPVDSTANFNYWHYQLLLVPKVLIYYLGAIIMPLPSLPLTFLTSVQPIISIISFIVITVIYSGIGFCGKVIKRKNSNTHLWFYFFFFVFLTATLFHSQIIPLDVLISKRWLYVQLFAVLGLVGILVQRFHIYLKPYSRLVNSMYFIYLAILILETYLALKYY